MLHQISWFTYVVSIISIAILYYLYISLAFYRTEIRVLIYRLTGKAAVLKTAGAGDLRLPDHEIMGKAQPEAIEFVSAEELSFGPADETEEYTKTEETPAGTDSQLISYFSEMVSEVKTLIRVINESSESKENFEMLFRLIIQKYPAIAGTPYQQQINAYLIAEGIPEFPFSLTETDLANYWTEEN